MQQRRFVQCDVFTAEPTRGNGLAVVLDGEGLTDEQMQTFAAWTNLAETTFLFPPTDPSADYKVRIFTPVREMPFAGPPYAWAVAQPGATPVEHRGMTVVVRQECAVGIVDIDISGGIPAFRRPAHDQSSRCLLNRSAPSARCSTSRTASIIRTARLNNGPVWQVLELAKRRGCPGCRLVKDQLAHFQGGRPDRSAPRGRGVPLRGPQRVTVQWNERRSDHRFAEFGAGLLDAR